MNLSKQMTKTALALLLCQNIVMVGKCSTLQPQKNNLSSNRFIEKVEKARLLLSKSTPEMLVKVETIIKKAFSDEEFRQIAQMRAQEEQRCDESDEPQTYCYAHFAAIGGSASAQQKWSEYLLSQGRYSESARWYIRAALSGSMDCDSYLNHLMHEEQFKHHPQQSLQKNLADYWEKIYSYENITHSISSPNASTKKLVERQSESENF